MGGFRGESQCWSAHRCQVCVCLYILRQFCDYYGHNPSLLPEKLACCTDKGTWSMVYVQPSVERKGKIRAMHVKRLSRRRSKKISKLRLTGLCAGKSPVIGEFPAQMASNAENVSIWWHHHVLQICSWLYSMVLFYRHSLSENKAWIRNFIKCFLLDVITDRYLVVFLNHVYVSWGHGCNYTPYFYLYVINYACPRNKVI